MFCHWSTAGTFYIHWEFGVREGNPLLNRIILSVLNDTLVEMHLQPHRTTPIPFSRWGACLWDCLASLPQGKPQAEMFSERNTENKQFCLPTQNRLNLSSLNTQKKSCIVFIAEQDFVLNVLPVSPDHRPQDATWGFAAQRGPHPCAPHGCPEAGGAEAERGRRKTLPCPFLWQQENLVSVCRELRVRRFNRIFGMGERAGIMRMSHVNWEFKHAAGKRNLNKEHSLLFLAQEHNIWQLHLHSPASFTQSSHHHKNTEAHEENL